MRIGFRLITVIFAVVACTTPTGQVDPTGILLLGPDEKVQARPTNEVMASSFSAAMVLAEANDDDLGYPWIDPATGTIILSVATPRGLEILEGTDPARIRDVAHSAGEIRRIVDDVTFLGGRGVADAQLIYATYPDHRDNRAVIVISAMSRPLLDYLASHYPPDALAVQVNPNLGPAKP